MFTLENNVFTSDTIRVGGVRHAFSTRLGGVSENPATGSMNVAPGHTDSDEIVRRNTDILCRSVGTRGEDSVCAHQLHSIRVRYISESDRGAGYAIPAPFECDGFFTDIPGIALMVRTADCTPLLLAAPRAGESPVVAAIHAGWRGTCAGIAAIAAASLRSRGAIASDIVCAIGPAAVQDDFEVGEDMYKTVSAFAGTDFAARHIVRRGGRLFADVQRMNAEILMLSGIPESNIDICAYSTVSNPKLFHSHRRTGQNRGAMGNVIAISNEYKENLK